MFVAVSAKYTGSCFGRPLTDLVPEQEQQEQQQPAQEAGQESEQTAEDPVPAPVHVLCTFLSESQRPETNGLLLHSFDVLCGNPPRGNQPMGEAQRRLLLKVIAPVRQLLEAGQPLPDDLDPHLAAGTLLALLQQLPTSLIPRPIADLCSVCVPTPLASQNLLMQWMSPAERGTTRSVLRLLKAVSEPAMLAKNNISSAVDLCMAMTYSLMPQLVAGERVLEAGGGGGVTWRGASLLQGWLASCSMNTMLPWELHLHVLIVSLLHGLLGV